MSDQKKKVLFIDDEASMLSIVSEFLSRWSFIPLCAMDGEKGLELFRSERPDIVLVDLRLPGISGHRVLDTIRRESPGTPTIVISGTGNVHDVIKALRLGAWDYLAKPIEEMDLLRHAVNTCIERAMLLEENRKYRKTLELMVQQKTEELYETNRQLRQAQKMEAIGALAGGIAHDFNNILGAIIGYTELTLFKMPENSPYRAALKQVLKASNRATDLVRQILTFTRNTEQKMVPVDISSIIKDGLKMLRATLPATIKMRSDFNVTTPVVRADPTQIYQVLMNLCTNAAQAMGNQVGILTIALSEKKFDDAKKCMFSEIPAGRYVELLVSDTGCGISPETIEKIFDPYFTTKEKGEGTGLGLSVALGIVKNHEGGLCVESDPEKGSVFYVYFPICELCKPGKLEETIEDISGDGEDTLLDI